MRSSRVYPYLLSGYFECTGLDPEVKGMLYKIASLSLCPPVSGQIVLETILHPPKVCFNLSKEGDASYSLYHKEYLSIFESLKRRAIKLATAFNSLEGVTCNAAEGAMYLFPTIHFTPGTAAAAAEANMQPDEFYCMEMLKATGVCVVSGTGFGQVPGSWHFRSTFLPQEDDMDGFIADIKQFHKTFSQTYK